MPLSAGQTLSFYEVLGSLGAGAMGEVYRARDTRLGREVAIKVLPEAFVEDEERLRRFEREARTLASLNHPNVAGIHGIDQVEDTCFIAMELVPGADLSECLGRGALPMGEALDVGRQIAEGLEAAHAAGVVHRDLKPANVRVTPDGKVKLLDFGLAKPTNPDVDLQGELATTEAGRILGTPAYMSPEQSRGKPIDARSDVWALGCILFECLTGQRAFQGDSVPYLLVAIAEKEPDWSVLPAATPARVRRLLDRCLTKDCRARLQAAGEARIVLEDPGAAAAKPPVTSSLPRNFAVLSTLGAVLLMVLGYFVGSRSTEEAVPTTIQLNVELPAGQMLDLPNPRSAGIDRVAPPLTLSSDGRALVFQAREGVGPTGLYLRRLDSFETRLLEGTENAEAPFFSYDGRWVAFFRDGGIFKVAVRGGSGAIPVCSIAIFDRPSATWAADDTIIFSRGINAEGRLERVPASGGEPEELTVPDSAAGESWHGLPQLLPDGNTVLFTVSAAGVGTRAALLDLETRVQRVIEGTGEAAGARFFREGGKGPGLLLFAQAGRLLTADFDLDSGKLTGVPWPVVEQVSSSALGIGHWDCSESGALAYVSGNVAETELVFVNRRGEVTWKSPEIGVYQHPRISADGRQLLFDWMKSGGRDIYVYDLEQAGARRLTFEYRNMDPLWAPDGERIVFSRFVGSVRTLHLLDPGKVAEKATKLLEEKTENQIAGTWTATGELLFTMFGREKEDLWLLSSLEEPEAQPVLQRPGRQGFGAISPDGRFLAYCSDASGRLEVYVCSYPELADEQQITFAWGSEPLWSGDGTELFFRAGPDSSDFYAASVSAIGDGLELDEPALLFSGPYDRSPSGHQHYDVSSDGKRFALVRTLQSATESELRIILSWRPRSERTTGR